MSERGPYFPWCKDQTGIGGEIKHARRDQGWTQEDLSSLTNIPRSRIAQYENNRRSISWEVWNKLTEYLDDLATLPVSKKYLRGHSGAFVQFDQE